MMVTYYENGNVRELVEYKNGVRQGAAEVFTRMNKYVVGQYDNGEYHGNWIVYHPNGIVKQSGDYKNGKARGEWFYYPSGDASMSGKYVNDRRQGIWTEFSEQGEVKSRALFVNDEIILQQSLLN